MRTFPAQVDFLVCDRTFASLDAVAARLLGAWAGYGIRFLALWKTDVVADFLATTCPKVSVGVNVCGVGVCRAAGPARLSHAAP